MLDAETAQKLLEKLFVLFGDGGVFAVAQMHEYVSQKTRRLLSTKEKAQLYNIAIAMGCVAEKAGLAAYELLRIPDGFRRKPPPRVRGKKDKHTLDMFGGK